MMKRVKESTELRIKSIIFILSLLIFTCIIHTQVEASTVTSYCSSDNKDSYYTLNLEQDRITVTGRTTENVNNFKAYLYDILSTGNPRVSFQCYAVGGNYNTFFKIPSKNGIPIDGTYQLCIQLKDAQGMPFIIVKDGIPSFYQNDKYDKDIIGNEYIKSINTDELLKSDTSIYEASATNVKMTQSQIDELHQLALDITKGISSDYAKAKAIYQWVTDNIYYDKAYATNTVSNGDNNPYSVYKNRYGVCEGYSRLLVELLKSIQIPSAMVLGDARYIPTSSDVYHAWAVIYADGRWFYVDPTWDSLNTYENATFKKGASYLHYFDLSLNAISMDHHIKNIEVGINLNGFFITFFNENISVNGYTGTEAEIVLPAKLNNLPITQVTAYFDKVCNIYIKEIIVPEGYRILPPNAFANYVYLRTIALPDSIVWIDKDAFYRIAPNITIYNKNNKVVSDYCNACRINLIQDVPDYLDYKNFNTNTPLMDIKKANVALPDKVIYSGTHTEPKLSVTYNGKTLVQGVDYTLSNQYFDEAGTVNVVIYGMGSFIGEKQFEFVILPSSVKMNLLSNKSKSVQIKWDASSSAQGYKIYYSTAKNGKYKLLKDTETLKFTASKLSSGKTYYFKIRPYVYYNGDKTYGAYSKVNGIKVM